jgi:hypothetical protein
LRWKNKRKNTNNNKRKFTFASRRVSVKRSKPAKQIKRGRGRGLDGPWKLDPMPLGIGNTLVVLMRPRVVEAESDCMNCKSQINFVVS